MPKEYDRYNYQIIVLDSNKNIAASEEELRKQWEEILKQNWKHYRVVGVHIRRPDFQMVVVDTDQGTAKDAKQVKSIWGTRLDELKLPYRVSGALVNVAMGADR